MAQSTDAAQKEPALRRSLFVPGFAGHTALSWRAQGASRRAV
jgi:hypothetical protein